MPRNRAVFETPAILLLLATGLAAAQPAAAQCPRASSQVAALPCKYDLDCGNGLLNVTGTLPLAYTWEYHNGAGWMPFPTSPGPMFVNGVAVGTGYAGNTSSAHFTAYFVTGLTLVFDTRCTVTSFCGTLVAPFTRGVRYCMADFYCDGQLDFNDYLEFMDYFMPGDVLADFNQDAVVDVFDYLDFLEAFTAGCA